MTDYGSTYYETTDSWGTTDYETTDYYATTTPSTVPPNIQLLQVDVKMLTAVDEESTKSYTSKEKALAAGILHIGQKLQMNERKNPVTGPTTEMHKVFEWVDINFDIKPVVTAHQLANGRWKWRAKISGNRWVTLLFWRNN